MSSYTYEDIVSILRVSQERPAARQDRYETFRRAVLLYGKHFIWPTQNSFLIAGTNGKGTVAKTLETLLFAEPKANVGLFTSPHLMEPTERIRSEGRDLTPSELIRLYEWIEPTVQKFDLSHFEILTLLMMETFFGGRVRDRVTHAVIEVGVGGRLDPTRLVPHQTAVLASLGLDHEAILGSTLDLIAREKLAIAEGAERLVFMSPPEDLRTVFAEAERNYAPCKFIEARRFPCEVERGPRWTLTTPWGKGDLALLGDRAAQNTSLALEALHASGFMPDVRRLKNVIWPGRMEKLAFRGRALFFSGDHNEQGVESLRDLLRHFDYETLWLVVGVGKGKPVDAMLSVYRQIPRAKLILTTTSFRPMTGDEFARLDVETKIANPLRAVEWAVAQARPHDLIVVSGSLYLVGDLRAVIQSSERTKPIT